MKKKLLCLTRYQELGASSRVRFFQYYESLSDEYELSSQSLLGNLYIRKLYKRSFFVYFLIPFYYFRRLIFLFFRKSDNEVLFIEKELFPYLPYSVELIFLRNKKYILDYDDAIFENYNGKSYESSTKNSSFKNRLIRFLFKNKIPKLIKGSLLVINGNDYLNKFSEKENAKKSIIIPSSIKFSNYKDHHNVKKRNRNQINVGWIGNPGSQISILEISSVFKSLVDINFIFIGIKDVPFYIKNAKFLEWKEETEVQSLTNFDIGIMPLKDLEFQRGKCAYKLIQYMACGVPVIASPVGVNAEIITDGENGFLASSSEEWLEKLNILINDHEMRQKFSTNGRKLVEKGFTVEVNKINLINSINSIT
tara:strand:- start:434 stop:1528 length:1095 start_codon:yes stop_codon:yes gene_type:complete